VNVTNNALSGDFLACKAFVFSPEIFKNERKANLHRGVGGGAFLVRTGRMPGTFVTLQRTVVAMAVGMTSSNSMVRQAEGIFLNLTANRSGVSLHFSGVARWPDTTRYCGEESE
jgi:hypothetical protein